MDTREIQSLSFEAGYDRLEELIEQLEGTHDTYIFHLYDSHKNASLLLPTNGTRRRPGTSVSQSGTVCI